MDVKTGGRKAASHARTAAADFVSIRHRDRTWKSLQVQRHGPPGRHAAAAASSRDRVLRYPDGVERLIRYPSAAQEAAGSVIAAHLERAGKAASGERSHKNEQALDWHICGENDTGCLVLDGVEADASLPGAAPVGPIWADEEAALGRAPLPGTAEPTKAKVETFERPSKEADPAASPPPQPSDDARCTSARPSVAPNDEPLAPPGPAAAPTGPFASPDALRRAHADREARLAQQADASQLRGCYEVLQGCPWVEPRQVFVLARQQAGDTNATVVTMPTSVDQEEQGNELDKLVSAGSASSRIRVQHVREGVLLFQDGEQASRFCESMERRSEVLVSELSSHELFRMAVPAGLVVVHVKAGDYVPDAAQLRAELRAKPSFEDL